MNEENVSANFPLYDFPNEILLQSMLYLNDVSLLDMTRVCKRFHTIAKEAFAKKYSGKTADDYFELNVFCESEIEEYKRYRPIFVTFGENIGAIEIRFFDDARVAKDHWFIEMITQYCTSLACIYISGGLQLDLTGLLISLPRPTLTHLKLNGVRCIDQTWASMHIPNLISFSSRYAIERTALDLLIQNNPQIKNLEFSYCHFDVDMFRILVGRMNELTSLVVHDFTPILGETFEVIELPALETFELRIDPDTSLSILNAIILGCKQLKKLVVDENSHSHISWNDVNFQCCCNMLNLEILTLCVHNLGDHRLSKLVQSLPKLSSFTLKHFYDETDAYASILGVIAYCSKLTNLIIDVCGSPPELSESFLKQIATITKNHPNYTVKFIRGVELVSNQGAVTSGDGVIYWDGFDPTLSQSALHLLDLNDSCLEQIIGFLDMNSKCKLFNTCQRTQHLVAKYISENIFRAQLTVNIRILEILGKYIRRLNVEINIINLVVNEQEESVLNAVENWKLINQHCPNVTELLITSTFYIAHDIYLIPNLIWPNLKKLIFSTPYPVTHNVLRLVSCPNLTYLEIDNFSSTDDENDHASSEQQTFSNLTTLKFGCYNENVRSFLEALDTDVCQQMQVLSITNLHNAKWNFLMIHSKEQRLLNVKLINIVCRFRNLTTLHLIIPDLISSNLQFLFENCSKVTDLAICSQGINFQAELQVIKKNCQFIKSILIVVRREKAPIQAKLLKSMQKLLPGVSVRVVFDSGRYTFTATSTELNFVRS